MKSVDFDEANVELAKNQEEYNSVFASYDKDTGHLVACFELTDKEIVELLITKKLWYKQLTFKNPTQPFLMTTKKEDVL